MQSTLAFVQINKRVHNVTGVWGPVDAVHQFCEPHYRTTVYLAECYNALSSLWYIFLAYRLLRTTKKPLWILRALAGWLGVIGIGSFLFHGTMRRSMQLLDEGPMMGSIGTALWWKLGLHPWSRKRSALWRSCMVIINVGIVLLYIVVGSYELFVHGFTSMVVLDTILAYTMKQGDTKLRNQCVATILFARIFWEMENLWCETYPRIWIAHIVWHVASGLAAYYGVLYNVSLQSTTHLENQDDDKLKKQS
ncbi:dihydroceramidase [Fistulifera solaris]|uniref:Dihydroceramidase n=1 Tax=Fistulifera solaris TaxID=1519565 RepID=A0A1Z5KLX9_FISSO|nr:dihydroceramidase [Fistulifera solaris]|eukprot:GAX27135.1 dihydroceramidase [Fistulifera solaris]